MPVRVNVCHTCVSRCIFLGCKNQFSSVWAVYCLLCAAGICRTHILCIFIVECDRTPTILYTLYSSQNSTYIISIQACLYVSVINFYLVLVSLCSHLFLFLLTLPASGRRLLPLPDPGPARDRKFISLWNTQTSLCGISSYATFRVT